MTETEEAVKGPERQPRKMGQRRIHVGAWVNIQMVGELNALAAARGISLSHLIADAITLESIIKAMENVPHQEPHVPGSGRPRGARQPRRYNHERAAIGGRITPSMHKLIDTAAKEMNTSVSGIVSQILADLTGVEL